MVESNLSQMLVTKPTTETTEARLFAQESSSTHRN